MSETANDRETPGFVGGFHLRPDHEQYVDPEFPDSEYDADPTFGRDDLDVEGDLDDDDDDLGTRDATDARIGADLGLGTGTADELAAGDLADRERIAAELRLRRDAASTGDRGDLGEGGLRDGAGSFAEGASRLTREIGGRNKRTGPSRSIGQILNGAVVNSPGRVGRTRRGTKPKPKLIVTATPRSVSSLAGGKVSVTFHIAHEFADIGMEIHKLQDQPVRLEIYKESQ